MPGPLSGVKVIEVAAWTFVPSGCAVLAEWGADVIKVEPPERGDPQRGLITSGLMPRDGVNFMVEIPNRGKRSIGIDISTDKGREVLYSLVETADVFVTSFLPPVRRKLGIELEQIRARNPDIIYVRGSALGSRGEEADRGGYDSATYWARAGIASALTEAGSDWPVSIRPGFGDIMGGMTLAGGVAAALVQRGQGGGASVVDVSLLGLGLWNLSTDITSSKLFDGAPMHSYDRHSAPNPLTGTYRTKDDRFITFMIMQIDRHWPDFCEHIDRPDLIDDARFRDGKVRYENRRECIQVLRDVFRTRTLAEWSERLKTLTGIWAPVNRPIDVHNDPQVLANGYLANITSAEGVTFAVPTNPVQFDQTPPSMRHAPGSGEHTDEVLLEQGMAYEDILALKVSGAIL
jgi:crotonobetainyl-CoA:carnitine CoA-transferase CaiB-like acyl-CoA transferase